MTAVATAGGGPGAQSTWARHYIPLLSLVVSLLLALIALPSALNLPQSNPTETLEFAPVPPDDEAPTPPSGNLSSLGLAGSGSLESGGAAGGFEGGGGEPPPPEEPPPGAGKTRQSKECVYHDDLDGDGQRDLRQTEDPLAPPCVVDFQGDNGGATWVGVTATEVRVLIYVQGFTNAVNLCRDPNQSTPDKQYFDLWEDPKDGEHCIVRTLRVWQRYFTDRWQTYGRKPHFFVYVSGEGKYAEERKADAAENHVKVDPFAVISTANSHPEAYLEIMAQRKVLNFGALLSRSEEFFQRYPGYNWGYFPSIQKQSDVFVDWVCKQIAPYPVSFHGNAATNGGKRVYGYWRTDDPEHPELVLQAKIVKQRLQDECGITFAAEHTFPEAGYVHSNEHSGREAAGAVADFSGKGVTTVIWPGGLETNFTKQAAPVAYRPEIVVMGDGFIEREASGTFQEQSVYDRAHLVTPMPFVGDVRQTVCYEAYKSVDPDGDDSEIQTYACDIYPLLRQLFTGIQVSGPQLRPDRVEQGYRAIPPVLSARPDIPACYYVAGDYTCVKDAMVERWDREGKGGQGCNRATYDGRRYFAGTWPTAEATTQEEPNDPCNLFDSTFTLNPAPPEDPSNF